MHTASLREILGLMVRRVLWVLALAVTLSACASPHDKAPLPAPAQAMTEQARCTASGSTWVTDHPLITQGYCAKGTAAQCQAAGGQWQRVCMMGTLACVQPYADAHKSCRTGADCQGQRCLQLPEARYRNEPQTGRCIANNNPCYFGIDLINGQPVPTAVAD